MWVPVRAGPVLLSITLLASCSEPPTDAGPNGRWAGTAVQPSLIPSAADPNAAPINRIRSVTTRVSDNVVIDVTEVDVSPANESWEVTLAIPGLDDATEVMVFVYLINVSGGNESVEFSGRSDPVTLISGESVAPTVAIVRGPIANLFTTAVTITTASSTMVEGMSQTFSAEVTTSESAEPTLFWTSLDPSVVSMAGPNATAITTPGAAQIVASAGAFADTVPSTVVGVLAVATSSVPAGIENVDYGTQTLTATGGVGAYTWSLASGSGPLPTGLSLAANGEITGIPTTPGTYDFTIEVTSDGSV